MANIGSMDDIQNLFKETIAEFMENGLEAELDDELGYSKYDYKNKDTDNSRNGHSSKTLRTSFGDVEVSVPETERENLSPRYWKETRPASSQDIEERSRPCTPKGMTSDIEAHSGYHMAFPSRTARWSDHGQNLGRECRSAERPGVHHAVYFQMPSIIMSAAKGRS